MCLKREWGRRKSWFNIENALNEVAIELLSKIERALRSGTNTAG
jgi:hypothetical protein